MMTKRIPILLLAAAALVTVSAARADAARGVVLRVEGDDIYVDVGNDQGVTDGDSLRLMHVIMAVHPVSKKKVRDTFFVGTLTVVRAGKTTSVVEASAELLPRVTVGDEIEIVGGEKDAVVDPWIEATKPKRVEGDEDPEEDEVDTGAKDRAKRRAEHAAKQAAAQAEVDAAAGAKEAWGRSLGRPPAERIDIWADYLRRYPKSPYAATVRAEIASLTQQQRADEERAARSEAVVEAPSGGAGLLTQLGDASLITFAGPLAFVPPARVYEGASLELAYLIVAPGSVTAGWVHYRRAGEDTFARVELVLDGDSYLRGHIAPGIVHAPAFEYFVEVMAAEGTVPQAVIGSAEAPATIAVDATVEEAPPDLKKRSRVSIYFDYVDFDGGFAAGYDQYVQFEADFMYRFRKPIYAMRVGIATLAGKGGPKDEIDDARLMGRPGCTDAAGTYHCRRVAFNYIYTELEFRASDLFAVMVRPMYGGGFQTANTDDDAAAELDEFVSAFGFRARIRIGRELETNLVLGVGRIGFSDEPTKNFGTLFEAAFTWDVLKQYPIVLTAQVTDQPVPEDYGVRLIGDIGWKGVSAFYPSVRVSYQSRDFDHQGFGAGLALNFDW